MQKIRRLVRREIRAFCSQRCRLVDLGKWLGGEHVISEPLRPEHFEKFADLPPGEQLDTPEV
jgi:endogenous inhibitor of DNA gyrase (YacG/DUF329 family)